MEFIAALETKREWKRKELKEIEKEILFWKICNEQNKIANKTIHSNLSKVFDALFLSQIFMIKNRQAECIYFFNLAMYEIKDKIDNAKLINYYYDYIQYIDTKEDLENGYKMFENKTDVRTLHRPKL